MGRQKLTIKDINIRLADRGIQIVGEYVNQRTKTVFKCQRAHVWEATHILYSIWGEVVHTAPIIQYR
ncbi:hypothetical protein MAR004NP2_00141 [Escherichia phage vB_Eco_mar004NP2]|uniref:Uncharacterized protein n=1 Tax=Escherichia phage vB_Eco_mar004NP2 TaxID=2419762 RepID=A0A3P4A8P2_9CAUD|nr:hypothetical protein HOV62_gp072 [Escherichia phage vB_Eco_mar004NP2]VCU43535.1 hypothetical protein MAR004NP2_00141 [Escherichia phage vB_Eco_mar004NP2]